MVNGAAALMPASPVPVNVSDPFNKFPDTGMDVTHAAVSPAPKSNSVHFFDLVSNLFVSFSSSLSLALLGKAPKELN
jgi:hypothetical protein